MMDAHREMRVVTSHNYTGTCIDSIIQDCFKLNLEDPSRVMTMYAAMHCSTFSMLTTDVALTWRQCCSASCKIAHNFCRQTLFISLLCSYVVHSADSAEITHNPIRTSPRCACSLKPKCSDYGPFQRFIFGNENYYFCQGLLGQPHS